MTHIRSAPVVFLAILSAFLAAPSSAGAQETAAPAGSVIASVDISGIGRDRLSHGLRADIEALTGTPLDAGRLRELAARIEEEHPERVAAARSVAVADGVAQVIFLVGRISDDRDLAANINARYVVERVEIAGVPDREVSAALQAELTQLEGRVLDGGEAERLEQRVAGEFPEYRVERRIRRGGERGRIRLVFELNRLESTRWIPFAASRSKIVFHEDQGWSGALDIPVGAPRDHRFTVGLVFGNDDDLVEEYSGFRFRVETVRVGTERLGLSLELARLGASWRDVTHAALAANPAIPAAYDRRLTVEPTVTFAPVKRLRLSAGVSVSELTPLETAPASESSVASAFTAGVAFDREWRLSRGGAHRVDAVYTLRSAARALDSDVSYRRHSGSVRYSFDRDHNAVIARAAVGYIDGGAPLFERFTLGDSSTLRGWNKYDIAPAGGDRLVHQSIEYRYHAIALFLDAGALWQEGEEAELRYSTGFGLHIDRAFFTVGVPLDAGRVGAAVMLGVRF